ncbi:WD40 repeat-like protein [Sistotremastrum niveocremeum HHB9708]|uniref:WD40 repeat-like protein n=1 Tax=Sistotremastrum niveocremeum HHB9708 TaxID=1314777 RepID=A0A164QDH6_9AGAM|nr:WD40 repeat-like protein [Sistotremastrum niveocremeum HHB9708]
MNYHQSHRLLGHSDSINALAFNLDGSLLASGGDDQKVIVWCMDRGAAIQELHDMSWGQITTIVWMGMDSEGRESIVFGCGRGMLHLYSQNKAAGTFVERGSVAAHSRTSIEALTLDAPGRRLASSSAHGDVCLWAITEEGSFNLLWSTRIAERHEGIRGLLFSDDHTILHVFCTETGYVHGLDVEHGGERRKTAQARSRIGSLSPSSTKRFVLVDNLDKGFTLYRFPTMGLVRHFCAASSLPWFLIKQAVFAESEALVVGGSDNGKVYIFDLPSARIVQVICHGRSKDPVQAVAAFSYENRHVIISGSSGASPEIFVHARALSGAYQARHSSRHVIWLVFLTLFICLLTFASLSALYGAVDTLLVIPGMSFLSELRSSSELSYSAGSTHNDPLHETHTHVTSLITELSPY